MATFQLASAASGAIRDNHWAYNNQTLGLIRTLLLEGTRTNLVLWNRDLTNGAWTGSAMTAAKTAIGVDGAANSASIITEDGTNALHNFQSAATFAITANVNHGVSCFLKANGRAQGTFYIFAGSDIMGIQYDLGAVTVTDFLNGASTRATKRITAVGGGWYFLEVVGTLNAASTTCKYGIETRNNSGTRSYQGDGASGVIVDMLQVENNVGNCSSAIATTSASVTRNTDILTFPFTPAPQVMTLYARFVNGTGINGATNFHAVVISNTSDAAPFLRMRIEGSGVPTLYHNNNTATVSSVSAITPALGDLVELRGIVNADGSVQLGVTLNGGAETLASASAANTFAAAWSSPTVLSIGAEGSGAQPGYFAFTHVHVELGVQTLATMRTLSGQ